MTARLLFGSSTGDIKANLNKKNALKLLILEELYRHGCKSIPELSKIIRMSTPTITRAIDELIHDELLIEEGIGSSSGGRRPNLYGINPSSRYVLGIDICRYSVRYGLFNFHNEPAAEIRVLNEGLETTKDIIGEIKKAVDQYIEDANIDESRLMGIGIALPGLIDIHTGISYSYLHEDKPLSSLFEDRFHHPVFVEHDTKAMALGEQAFGLAMGKQNVLCLNIGSGIGLGMILNGKLYHGNSGFSGEFGHIQVDPEGQLCYCGKIGCLETLASGTTMIRNARKEIEAGATTQISSLVNNDLDKITSEVILNAAQRGDQFAISLLSHIGEHLGRGIAVLIHLFNPELIIIGGELTKAENYLVDPIQQNLNKYTISKIRRDAQIITSSLGNNAGLLGTVALVMNKVFSKE
ncbi:MAG: ROK family transcriptional regulator [Bacteroidales bacterium]|nr:ROK family transcriptional regulator [Bacteroidales bacterium]